MSNLPPGDWKYISFDVFDTLLIRKTLTPNSVHLRQRSYGFSSWQILWRQNIEHFLRIKNGIFGVTRETSIKEISRFNSKGLIDNELRIEESILTLSTQGVHLLDQATARGAEIIFISDTVHSAEWLKAQFQRLGLINIPQIYTSNESRATKREGSLYQVIMNQRGWKPDGWLHIGDDLIADVQRPEALGITSLSIDGYSKQLKAILHPKHLDALSADSHLSSKLILGIIRQEFESRNNQQTPYFDFGFNVMGPLLVGFSQWLNQSLPKLDQNYFLGRDGYLPKIAAEILDPNLSNAEYLRASRRLLLVPAWIGAEQEPSELIKRIPRLLDESVNEYLARLRLPLDPTPQGDAKRNEALVQSLLREEVRQQACDELQKVRLLLNQVNGKSPIVDVGWRGTLQEAIEKIVGSHINGFYLGTISSTFIKPPRSRAWLLNSGKPHKMNKLLNQSIGLIERSFSELVESSFVNLNRELAQIIDPQIADIQNGALKFVTAWSESSVELGIEMHATAATCGLKAHMLTPRIEDVRLIGAISNSHHPQFENPNEEFLVPQTDFTMYKTFVMSPTASEVDANWRIGYEFSLRNHFQGQRFLRSQVLIWKIRGFIHLIRRYGFKNIVVTLTRIFT